MSAPSASAVQIKRAYDPPEARDGQRFLIDRLWPRGARKEALQLAGWIKEAAPGDALRRWFHHDPEKWEAFQKRYLEELEGRPEVCQPLLEAARQGPVTLVYGAKDPAHNNAVVLKHYLEKRLKSLGPRRRQSR